MSNRGTLRPKPQTTGSLMVNFKEGVSRDEKLSILGNSTSSQVESLSLGDNEERYRAAVHEPEVSVLFDELNIGITSNGFTDAEPSTESMSVLNTRGKKAAQALDGDDRILSVRPEYIMHPCWNFSDQTQRTWGLDATRVCESPFDGTGIKIAILDTGIDVHHPDNQNRAITYTSFVPNESAADGHGHGTHCAGTATGNIATRLNTPVRYGIASQAELYAAKVLSNAGSGNESWIISGMMWAIQEGCQIISMSLGRSVGVNEPADIEYERIGQFALDKGCLIVAAAGNDSARTQKYIAPVGAPANSPSILAVAAVDERLNVANFSCGGINGSGGEVNLAAPGVQVLSAVSGSQLYKWWPGTSMACPHVAGVAALWAQKDPNLRGQDLWDTLISNARELRGARRDVGAGLVQVPTA